MKTHRFPIILFLLVLLTSGIGAVLVNAIGSNTTGDAPSQIKFFQYSNGLGVGGYDVVAYFNQSKAVKGNSEFATNFGGEEWHFATAANKEAFLANPQKYLPRYGGHCAYGVASGYLVRGDPHAWSIHEGSLYLNYNKSVRKSWLSNKVQFIERGNQNWPELNT